ncbi:MAG: alpha/beta hydrolase [Nanoarchaeota archaeon]|nr:alpha/beta hydrolase [Nanoarchaeota archaeon]
MEEEKLKPTTTKAAFSWSFVNNKKTIVILALLTLLVLGIIIDIIRPKEYTPKKIEFDIECSIDNDCSDTLKECRGGYNLSCENGCVYGRCTKCAPACPEDPQCHDITCQDSVKVCPNGKTVRCSNYCDLTSGKCTSCTPDCTITTKDPVHYPIESEGFVLDGIPCTDATETEREEKIEMNIIQKNISKIKLPTGYSIIIEPFSADVNGSFDITLSIPENYAEVKALRCKGEECSNIRTKHVKELRCGDQITSEFLRKEVYLEPKFGTLELTETKKNLSNNEEIKDDRFKVIFRGNFEKLDVSLSMPSKRIKEAKNPHLKITGTPLIIKINDEIKEDIDATITLPYSNLEGFEEDSIGIYAMTGDNWDYIGGKIYKEDKTVTEHINNISRYLDENNEIQLSLMGILCSSCYNSSLNKIYEPKEGSKDAVILIHGFGSSANTYQKLIDDITLTNQPFQLWSFEYPSSNHVKDNSITLADLLERNQGYYENIYIVSHSLGGLVAQQALHYSFLENKKAPNYNYLNKVRKVLLVGTPNEGSPVVEIYRNAFRDLINDESGPALFNLKSKVMDELINGIITPQVPGITYYVIAGTKTYELNLLLFEISTEKIAKLYQKNDGIITTKSAQRIGDKYISNQCEDYWEINLTHTELIKDPTARRIIGRIISEDISKKDSAIVGHHKYFDLTVEDNSPGDNYIIIGKKLRDELIIDETGCKCGNGYCGEGEDEINCPSDCKTLISVRNKDEVRLFIFMVVILVLTYFYMNLRRYNHPNVKILLDHMKTNYEMVPTEGYNEEQIIYALQNNGWPKRIIKDVLTVLKKEFHHNYHKPLKNHIRNHLKKNSTEDEIKKHLTTRGWHESAVEKVLKGEELLPFFKLKKKHRRKKTKGKRHYFALK